MSLVIKGDVKAFEEIYDRYASKLMSYFHRMLWKDKEKAQDFTQDLFTKIVEKPDRYNPDRPFKTWLYSVANNMCKNEYKKQEIRKTSNEFEIRDDQLKSDYTDHETQRLDSKFFNKVLFIELGKIDPAKKETFILRYMDELSIKEISQIMDCSEGTVKSRLFYTLKILSPKLKAFNPLEKEVYDAKAV